MKENIPEHPQRDRDGELQTPSTEEQKDDKNVEQKVHTSRPHPQPMPVDVVISEKEQHEGESKG